MPIFMDFHKIEGVTIEDVKSAHIADSKIQEQFDVKYHQFWVNEEEGTVFCLIEGPDAATCEKVHQMAHGNIACALTEVETGFYEKMMGRDIKVTHGHVSHINNTIDNGYRSILVVFVYAHTTAKDSNDLSLLLTPHWAREIISRCISHYYGRDIKWEADDSLVGIFDDATIAVQCALQIQRELTQSMKNESPGIIFKMGISASQPVTMAGDFFKDSIKLAHRLSTAVTDNQILTTQLVKKLCGGINQFANEQQIRSLTVTEEDFIFKLLGIAEANLSELDFALNDLSSKICISRPQLYRKIKSLTGRSPNGFLHDLRMNKALTLLKQKKANISEIAFETGFNSPSYFTKCFSQKFGYKPSLLVKLV